MTITIWTIYKICGHLMQFYLSLTFLQNRSFGDCNEDPLPVVSLVSNRHLLEYETLTIDQWISKYTVDQVHVSHLAIQLISNKYKVKIYVYSLFEIDGIVEILPLSPLGVVPHVADCHVLHLSEVRCHNGHYISLRHKAGNYNS